MRAVVAAPDEWKRRIIFAYKDAINHCGKTKIIIK
jgi:hypothetical protein